MWVLVSITVLRFIKLIASVPLRSTFSRTVYLDGGELATTTLDSDLP